MVRVGLILVGHVARTSAHIEGDYPDLFTSLLGPLGIEIVTFDAKAGDLPASLDDCDGWLCSPSRSSVYDDLPWIGPTEEVVRAITDEERPYVGVCFGHQMTAHTLGGVVEKFNAAGASERRATRSRRDHGGSRTIDRRSRWPPVTRIRWWTSPMTRRCGPATSSAQSAV